MAINIPHDLYNNTPADAVPVDTNYKVIEQHINTNVIDRNGSIKMTGQLTLVGDPVSANHAVRKSYVDAMIPVGIMLPWLGPDAPAGGDWLLARGQTLQITDYTELYQRISTQYGTGGAGTFKLPNMSAIVPVGYKANDTMYGDLGNYGGSTKVPVPSHVHKMDHNHPSSATSDETTNHVHPITHNHGVVTTSSDGQHSHSGYFDAFATTAGGNWIARRVADSGTSTGLTQSAPNHDHTVDMPQYTGDSGDPKTKHKHTYDTPNFVGDTAAYKLEITDPDNRKSSTDFHAPFVVINYIVRVR